MCAHRSNTQTLTTFSEDVIVGKKSCEDDVIMSVANSEFRKFKKVQRARSLVFYFKPSYMYVYALDTIDRVNIQLVNASSMPTKLVLGSFQGTFRLQK